MQPREGEARGGTPFCGRALQLPRGRSAPRCRAPLWEACGGWTASSLEERPQDGPAWRLGMPRSALCPLGPACLQYRPPGVDIQPGPVRGQTLLQIMKDLTMAAAEDWTSPRASRVPNFRQCPGTQRPSCDPGRPEGLARLVPTTSMCLTLTSETRALAEAHPCSHKTWTYSLIEKAT